MKKRNVFLLVLTCMAWILTGCGDSGDTATRYITGTPRPAPAAPVQRDVTLSVLDTEGAAFIGAAVVLTGSETFTEGPVDESGALSLFAIPEGDYTVTAPGFSDTSAELAVVPGTDAYEVRLARKTADPGFTLINEDSGMKTTKETAEITDEWGLNFYLVPMQGVNAAEKSAYALSYADGLWTAETTVSTGAYRIGGRLELKRGSAVKEPAEETKFILLSEMVTVTDSAAAQNVEVFLTLSNVYIRILRNGRPLPPADTAAVVLGGISHNDYDGEEYMDFEFKSNAVTGVFNLLVQLKNGNHYLIPLLLHEDFHGNNFEIDLDRLGHSPRFLLTSGGMPVTSGQVRLYPAAAPTDAFKTEPVCPLVYRAADNTWQARGLVLSGDYRAVRMPETEGEPILSSAVFALQAQAAHYELTLDPLYSPAVALSVGGTFITENEWETYFMDIRLGEHFPVGSEYMKDRDYFRFEGVTGGLHTVTVTFGYEDESFVYEGTVPIAGDRYGDFTATVNLTGGKPWPFGTP